MTVSELSKLLGVSEVTIRSDLNDLEREGHLRRTRGGAAKPLSDRQEQPLEQTRKLHASAKRRIGQAAAALVEAGDTVFLDVGSTTTEIARHLPATLQGVTIVTNGLNIALELERLPNLNIVVSGGTLRRLQHSLVSPYGLDLISRFRPDKLFLGCNGVHAVSGVTNANHAEAEIKSRMVRYARQTIVVADHSKLGQISTVAIADLADVSLLITDSGAKPDDLAALGAGGLSISSV